MTGPGIDFLDDVGDADEELPAPNRRRRQRPTLLRGRPAIAAGVALALSLALLAGLAGVRLHGRHGDDRRAAAPTTPTPTTSVTLDPGTGRVISGLPLRTGPDPTRCPGLRCYTSPTVPAPVRAAVRAVFPDARFTAVETIRLVDRADGNPLWYREVDARAGSATLTLIVQAHTAHDQPSGDAKDDGARSVTDVGATLLQRFVRAHVSDRSGTDDAFDRLTRLATDRRLLAL